jgi:hypothetical protein
MTTVFTDFFRTQLYNSLDKTAPIDPSQNLFNPAKPVHWVFWRNYAAFTDENDPRYTAIKTVTELQAIPGWGAPLSPVTPTQNVGATTAGVSTFCIANNPFTMGGGWNPSTVSAAALVLEGTYGGTVDPIIYVTDDPFHPPVVLDADDTLIARPSSAIAGNRPLFAWPVFQAGQTTTVPSPGSVAVLEAPPAYEMAYTKHCWLYPQRVNFVANPSFELNNGYWRSNAAVVKTAATEPMPAAPGGGAWYGVTGSIAESNLFPLTTRVSVADMWTIQAMVRGTAGAKLKVGLLSWGPNVAETGSDWGPEDEEWVLPGSGWLHVFAQRRSAENVRGLVRFECDTGVLHLDNVLCEPDWLKDWPYFDGDSTYGMQGDHSWYGGENRKGATYSLWYNHKRAVTGRLFAWDIAADDFTITDEEVEAQGFVYKWVPAGVRVTPHLDVLFPGDIQEIVQPVTGSVTPYKTSDSDLLGVTNPWT